MESVITKIKPENSPLAQNSKSKYAWLVYDDIYRIRLHKCGKNFTDTCNSKDEMPVIAQGFLVYCIVEKRFYIKEKIRLYVKYKTKEEGLSLFDLWKEERLFYKQINEKLFEWLPLNDIKAIKKSREIFVWSMIKLTLKNIYYG